MSQGFLQIWSLLLLTMYLIILEYIYVYIFYICIDMLHNTFQISELFRTSFQLDPMGWEQNTWPKRHLPVRPCVRKRHNYTRSSMKLASRFIWRLPNTNTRLGGFNYLLFSTLGKISNLTNMFQMGRNHQAEQWEPIQKGPVPWKKNTIVFPSVNFLGGIMYIVMLGWKVKTALYWI